MDDVGKNRKREGRVVIGILSLFYMEARMVGCHCCVENSSMVGTMVQQFEVATPNPIFTC
jgi:hypothetical protein